LLCAPVCFNQPLWNNPGWTFTPQYCVSPESLLSSCFVWPQYGHYCFGDYYGSRFAGLGIQPWFNWGPRWHDSLFGHYRWAHRGDNWFGNQRALFTGRENGSLWRPGRTLFQQNHLLERLHNTNSTNRVFNQRNFVGNHNTLQTVTSFNTLRNRGVNSGVASTGPGHRPGTVQRPDLRTPRMSNPLANSQRPRSSFQGPSPGVVRTLSVNRTPGAMNRPSPFGPSPRAAFQGQRPLSAARPGANQRPLVNRTPGAMSRPHTSFPAQAQRQSLTPRLAGRSVARPAPRPAVRQAARRAARPVARPAARPAPRPAARPAARPAPRPTGGRRH
jgi:hypothetical protein